jgi:hypothetical protein
MSGDIESIKPALKAEPRAPIFLHIAVYAGHSRIFDIQKDFVYPNVENTAGKRWGRESGSVC